MSMSLFRVHEDFVMNPAQNQPDPTNQPTNRPSNELQGKKAQKAAEPSQAAPVSKALSLTEESETGCLKDGHGSKTKRVCTLLRIILIIFQCDFWVYWGFVWAFDSHKRHVLFIGQCLDDGFLSVGCRALDFESKDLLMQKIDRTSWLGRPNPVAGEARSK